MVAAQGIFSISGFGRIKKGLPGHFKLIHPHQREQGWWFVLIAGQIFAYTNVKKQGNYATFIHWRDKFGVTKSIFAVENTISV